MIDYVPYIRYVMRQRALSPHALAKLAGLSPSTISRYLKDDEEKFAISTRSIDKIAQATEISPAPFLDGGPLPDMRSSWEQHIDNLKANPESDAAQALRRAPLSIIECQINPGLWIDETLAENRELKIKIFVPTFTIADDKFYAQVNGSSLNKVAQDGDLLYCHRAIISHRSDVPGEGALVILRRTMPGGQLKEYSAMMADESASGVTLTYPSDDQRFQSARIVLEKGARMEGVEFLGTAISLVRPLLRTSYDAD